MHMQEKFDVSSLGFRPSAIFYPFLIMKLSMSELLSAIYGPFVSSSVMQNGEKCQNKRAQTLLSTGLSISPATRQSQLPFVFANSF